MKKLFYIFCVLTSITQGCKDYLDAKPDAKLSTLSSLVDLQSLLDDNARLNVQCGYAAEVSADDYYVTDTELAALSKDGDRRMYTWEKDNIFQSSPNGWYYAYASVYYGNSVLESLQRIAKNAENQAVYNNIKGQAYFFKGAAMLHASMVWTAAYDEANAVSMAGMPLRTNSDFNITSIRSNLADTYAQILSDLKQASSFLEINQVHVMRPGKAAAFAMLSRAYLSMNKYPEATLYADSALHLNNQLLDYNTLTPTATNPFPQYKGEVLLQWTMPTPAILNQSVAKINNELYLQYKNGDLRKSIFFKSNGTNYAFKGNYSGSASLFCGPAVDEMYLNRAEGYARMNKIDLALNDLNTLMIKRWNKNMVFNPYQSSNPNEVLKWILEERRKELLMRGLRWIDLKRLNRMGANIIVSRAMNSSQKKLLPNDSRYVLPIPEDVIQISGIEQNP